jgi:hypothetical protein
MFTKILTDMQTTLVEKDGTTTPEILAHQATSVLDTLSKPSDAVVAAGTFELGRRGYTTIRYEDFEAAFIAAVKRAKEAH